MLELDAQGDTHRNTPPFRGDVDRSGARPQATESRVGHVQPHGLDPKGSLIKLPGSVFVPRKPLGIHSAAS